MYWDALFPYPLLLLCQTVTDCLIGYSLSSCQLASSYMRCPCKGHGVGCSWLLLLKSKTGGNEIWNSQALGVISNKITRDLQFHMLTSTVTMDKQWQCKIPTPALPGLCLFIRWWRIEVLGQNKSVISRCLQLFGLSDFWYELMRVQRPLSPMISGAYTGHKWGMSVKSYWPMCYHEHWCGIFQVLYAF